jgi:predicted PurR-regulated permease PerM
VESRALPRALVVLLGLAAFAIVLAGLRSVSGIAGPTLLAVVLVITLYPVRTLLVRRGMPAWAASLLLLLGVYLVLLALTLTLIVSVGRMATLVPQYNDQLTHAWNHFGNWLRRRGVGREQEQALLQAFDLGKVVNLATGVLSSVLRVLSDLLFLGLLLLFLSFDASRSVAAVQSLAPSKPGLVTGLNTFAQAVRNYVAVSAFFGAIVAALDALALVILGIPGAFIWGVLAFVTNFIPNIGFVLGLVPPTVIGVLEGGPWLGLTVIIVYSVLNVIVQSVIQPRFIGGAVGLTPTLTFLSLVFWSWALGALGALLAVPLTLLVKAVLVDSDPDAHWALPLISGKSAP